MKTRVAACMTRAGRTVHRVGTAPSPESSSQGKSAPDVAGLIPMVRRIVGARVGAHPAAEDLVQETLVRVLAASDRIEPGMLGRTPSSRRAT